MKYFLFAIFIFLFSIFAVYAGGQADASVQPSAGIVNLDAALSEFSGYIAGRVSVTKLTAVAVTDVPVKKLGEYIADELTSKLLNNSGLRMVSRQDFERIITEQNLQAAIDFNDDTTARMGRSLGWQTIVFGTVNPMNDSYRLSLRAVDVETGELRGSRSFTLNGKDPLLISLVNPEISVEKLAERESILQPFSGRSNNFELAVSTNKNVFYDNEEMFITLKANEDCYFVVYHVDVYDNMQVIFPNAWDRNTNFLKADIAKVIPERASYIMCAPFGEERILVYASETQFQIPSEQFRPRSISRDFLDAPDALWHIETDDDFQDEQYDFDFSEWPEYEGFYYTEEPGGAFTRGLRTTPRGATSQAVYTILPK